jgi:hypothetical protein
MGLDAPASSDETPPVLEVPALASPAKDAATYLAAALGALAREEHAGRRPKRLLEPAHATWARFRGRLGPRDFAELLLEDAAVTQAEPFDAAAVLGRESPFREVPESLVADWLAEVPRLPLDAGERDYIDTQARRLGLAARPAFSDLRRLQPHHRVLEVPGSGGRLAAHVVQTQPGIFLKDVFTIACGSWQERMLAGLVAVDLGTVGEVRIQLDPQLDRARAAQGGFTHVFGLRPDKGGAFTAEQLQGWFPTAEVALV